MPPPPSFKGLGMFLEKSLILNVINYIAMFVLIEFFVIFVGFLN